MNELNLKLENENDNYNIKIVKTDSNLYECYLWTKNGMISLLHNHFKTLKEFDKAKNVAIKDFENNIICCSDCGKKYNYSKIKHQQFFAGVYCDNCWKNIRKDFYDYYN